MLQIRRTYEAFLDEMNLITIIMPKIYRQGLSNSFTLQGDEDVNEQLQICSTFDDNLYIKYECKAACQIEVGKSYAVYDDEGCSTDLQVGAVIRTSEFDELYAYDGNDLGVTFSKKYSLFKLWAPSATKVKLKITNPIDNEKKYYEMNRGNHGVWDILIHDDLEGVYYSYLVCVNLIWKEAIDPYAVAISVNSEYGVIVDFKKTAVQDYELPPLEHATDAVIYEIHTRDFSTHPNSGINEKGKYKGLIASQTSESSGSYTGFSYLVDLGITHVELMPCNDFAGVDDLTPEKTYNWGYNPLHYNAPEGSYSSNPQNPYNRINELKKVITTFHKNGLRVVLDVVYNHVYIREQSSFEKIVPGYFFRHDENGLPSNGTGVGNDIASERRMVRKFIIDSVLFWLNEYHIDGFRFDLMGILDVDTMNRIRTAVDEIDSSIILFGEGWDLPTSLPTEMKATIQNAKKLPRIGHFNDQFRDRIKGSTFKLEDKGFSLGNSFQLDKVKEVITGSISYNQAKIGMFDEPVQSINYVESHDNHTMWDKMLKSNADENEETRMKRQRLATAIVLLSQGIPFVHSGQEFFRTKLGVENSYKSPDEINWLDWDRKVIYESSVRYTKGLLLLRKKHRAFRFPESSLIRKHLKFITDNDQVIAYQLLDVAKYGPWAYITVIHNSSKDEQLVKIDSGEVWEAVCHGDKTGITPLIKMTGNQIIVPSISTLVLIRN
ncbi:type I pullulanase [Cytobacillus sp. IB215665]|uniref:type I pullulanase n=1 Tax=Cytobacillus sp. IB215665 TaxID=3097357 RepID=UPI002A0EED96|nr:type I pullulanase [Cytobacillus sp. IB215665]MDX8367476.1 type I pullulanase [Cytobacillus sp. IB215665]